MSVIEHRDDWVSYCAHVNDDGTQDCDCAPELDATVAEVERLREAIDVAREVLASGGDHPDTARVKALDMLGWPGNA